MWIPRRSSRVVIRLKSGGGPRHATLKANSDDSADQSRHRPLTHLLWILGLSSRIRVISPRAVDKPRRAAALGFNETWPLEPVTAHLRPSRGGVELTEGFQPPQPTAYKLKTAANVLDRRQKAIAAKDCFDR